MTLPAPNTSSSISFVIAPGRRITALSPDASTMVDSTPKSQAPPSRIMGIFPSISTKTDSAVVGLGRPEILAEGAAMGTPAAAIKARATSCSGMRTPTVASPPVILSGTMLLRGRIKVMGPGQKAAMSFSAFSGIVAAIWSIIERLATWRIKGLSEGRPLA